MLKLYHYNMPVWPQKVQLAMLKLRCLWTYRPKVPTVAQIT